MNTFRLLDSLARAYARGDASVLSALRRGWSEPLALYPIVAPFLPVPPSAVAEDVSLLVARLFGDYPRMGDAPLAVALRRAADRRASPTITARMTAILNAPRADLPRHLRRAVLFAKAEAIPIDWHRLFEDLLRWGDASGATQRAWARQFWASPDTPGDDDATSPSTASETA